MANRKTNKNRSASNNEKRATSRTRVGVEGARSRTGSAKGLRQIVNKGLAKVRHTGKTLAKRAQETMPGANRRKAA